jgi:hypothetical protein
MNITPETDGYLSVHEGSEVVDRQPDRLAARRIGDDVDSVFQPVREVPGGSLSGHGFHAQLGEGLVMDDEGMVIASVAATLGHDDPFRVGTRHDRLSLLSQEVIGLDEVSNVVDGLLDLPRFTGSGAVSRTRVNCSAR